MVTFLKESSRATNWGQLFRAELSWVIIHAPIVQGQLSWAQLFGGKCSGGAINWEALSRGGIIRRTISKIPGPDLGQITVYFTPSLIWLNVCMLARPLQKNQEMQNLTKISGGNTWSD